MKTQRFLFGTVLCWIVLPVLFLATSRELWADGKVDPKLPKYQPVAGLSGQIKSVGSDSMNSLMTQWTEKFKEYYKGVRTEVEGQGSSKAMPALIEGGTVDVSTVEYATRQAGAFPAEVEDLVAELYCEIAVFKAAVRAVCCFAVVLTPAARSCAA